MPPARRKGGSTPATARSQSTLSFGTRSKITKPSSGPSPTTKKAKDLEQEPLPVSAIQPDEASIEADEKEQVSVEPHVAEVVARGQAKAEVQQPLSEEDKNAKQITQEDLKRYWRDEESKRKVPRGLSLIPLVRVRLVKRFRGLDY